MKFLQVCLLFCLVVVTIASCQKTPKWEISTTTLHLGYSWGYHVLPIEMNEAYSLGWKLLGNSTCEHNGTFYGYRMVGYVEALFGLYDVNGILAGVQIPIRTKFQGPTEDVTQIYTVYFVDNEHNICRVGRTLAQLSDSGLIEPHFHSSSGFGYEGPFPGHRLQMGNFQALVRSINVSGGYASGNYTGF